MPTCHKRKMFEGCGWLTLTHRQIDGQEEIQTDRSTDRKKYRYAGSMGYLASHLPIESGHKSAFHSACEHTGT